MSRIGGVLGRIAERGSLALGFIIRGILFSLFLTSCEVQKIHVSLGTNDVSPPLRSVLDYEAIAGIENITLTWINPPLPPPLMDIIVDWRMNGSGTEVGNVSSDKPHRDILGEINTSTYAINHLVIKNLAANVPINITLTPMLSDGVTGIPVSVIATPYEASFVYSILEGPKSIILSWRNPSFWPALTDIRIDWRNRSSTQPIGSVSRLQSHENVLGAINISHQAANSLAWHKLEPYVPLNITLTPLFVNGTDLSVYLVATPQGPLPPLSNILAEGGYENITVRWMNPRFSPVIKDIRMSWWNQSSGTLLGTSTSARPHPIVKGDISLNSEATNSIALTSLIAYIPIAITLTPLFANGAGPPINITVTPQGPLPPLSNISAEGGYENVTLRWINPHSPPAITDVKVVWRERSRKLLSDRTFDHVLGNISTGYGAANSITLGSLAAYVPLTITVTPFFANGARGSLVVLNVTPHGPLPQLAAVSVASGYENVTVSWLNPSPAPELVDVRIGWRDASSERLLGNASRLELHRDALGVINISHQAANSLILRGLEPYVSLNITLTPMFVNGVGPPIHIMATPQGPLPLLRIYSAEGGYENVTLRWINPRYAPEITEILITWRIRSALDPLGTTSSLNSPRDVLGGIKLSPNAVNSITLSSLTAYVPLTITLTLLYANNVGSATVEMDVTPHGPLPRLRAYAARAGHNNITVRWTNPDSLPPLENIILEWRMQAMEESIGTSDIANPHPVVFGEINGSYGAVNEITITDLAVHRPVHIMLTPIFANGTRGSAVYLSSTPIFTCTNDKDCDDDGVRDAADIDKDGDGLIELWTAEMFNNIRFQLNGSGYRSDGMIMTNQTGCGNGVEELSCRGYELMDDISLADYADGRWLPLGTEEDPFRAVLDGNGYVISDLVINRSLANPLSKNLGIFGYANMSYLTNMALTNISIDGVGIAIGGLVGEAHNSMVERVNATDIYIATSSASYRGGLIGHLVDSNLSHTSVTQAILGTELSGSSLGGLVGCTMGYVNILSSYASADIQGSQNIGGLVGVYSPRVDTFYRSIGELNIISSGTDEIFIKGWSRLGGLLGDAQGSVNILSSFTNRAIIVGEVTSIGGLVGQAVEITIIASYSRYDLLVGNVNLGGLVGGIVGDANIISSYARGGAIAGFSTIGGLTGYGDTFMANSFSATSIFSPEPLSSRVDGLTYRGAMPSEVIIRQSYYDNSLASLPPSADQIGLSTEQLQSSDNQLYVLPWHSIDERLLSESYGSNFDSALAIWCDNSADYRIDAKERRPDNLIWDYGNNNQYPALRCAAGGIKEQRRDLPVGVSHFNASVAGDGIINLSWQNPNHLLEDLIIVWSQAGILSGNYRLSELEHSFQANLTANGWNNITVSDRAVGMYADTLFTLIPIYADGRRGIANYSYYAKPLDRR